VKLPPHWMDSTCGYNTCWKLHPLASDRGNECLLQRFTYETFQLPTQCTETFRSSCIQTNDFAQMTFLWYGRMIKDLPIAFLRIEVWHYLNLRRAYALTIPRTTYTTNYVHYFVYSSSPSTVYHWLPAVTELLLLLLLVGLVLWLLSPQIKTMPLGYHGHLFTSTVYSTNHSWVQREY